MTVVRCIWKISPSHPFWTPQWTREDFFPAPALIHHLLCRAAQRYLDPSWTRFGILHFPTMSLAGKGNLIVYFTNLNSKELCMHLPALLRPIAIELQHLWITAPSLVYHTIIPFYTPPIISPLQSLAVLAPHPHTISYRTFHIIRTPTLIPHHLPYDSQLQLSIPLHDFLGHLSQRYRP